MDTELLRGVGAGCGSNPVSMARAPQHAPSLHSRTPATASSQAGKQVSAGCATPRSAGRQVRASLRTRGEAAREWHRKGALSGPVGTPGQARPWRTAPHALSRHDNGRIAQPQGGPRAAIQQVPHGFHPWPAQPRFPIGPTRPVTAGLFSAKTGRPRTPRVAALSG
jgi:hypothetical protein